MSDIPADILFNAKCLVSEWELISRNVEYELVVSAIARALMAERERSAQVALSWATDVRNPQTARFTAGHIATAIRKPKQIESGANAAADSPALCSVAATRIATNGDGND